MSAEENDESSVGEASGSGGGSKLVTIITIVNLLVSVGVGAVVFLSFKKEKTQPAVEDIASNGDAHGESAGTGGSDGHGEAKKGEAPKKLANFGKMVTLEQFTVNLATPGSVNPRFVRVNISVEVPNDDAEGEVTHKMPQVRNVIIDLFNSKRPADLATAEGREYLKEEIRNALNGFMVNGKVKNVFFTNFAISS